MDQKIAWARASARGAATIVNAIATGKGAAFGISLETRATVVLDDSLEFRGEIAGCPGEDTRLIESCVRRVVERFSLPYGAFVRTGSDIPVASGLKSSSTAANAAVLATLGAVKVALPGAELSDKELLDIAVDAALEAKVSITGAFDDASASFYGGYVVTDNKTRSIIQRGEMNPDLEAIILAPEEKRYTAAVDVGRTKTVSREVGLAWDTAANGDIYAAMTINGLLYSAALGMPAEPAIAALEAGAVAAGLSGKGPCVVALSRCSEDSGRIRAAWEKFDGRVLTAKVNNSQAHVTGSGPGGTDL